MTKVNMTLIYQPFKQSCIKLKLKITVIETSCLTFNTFKKGWLHNFFSSQLHFFSSKRFLFQSSLLIDYYVFTQPFQIQFEDRTRPTRNKSVATMSRVQWLLLGSCLMLISQIQAVTEELSPGEFFNKQQKKERIFQCFRLTEGLIEPALPSGPKLNSLLHYAKRNCSTNVACR